MQLFLDIYPHAASLVAAVLAVYAGWAFHRSMHGHPTWLSGGMMRAQEDVAGAQRRLREDLLRAERSVCAVVRHGSIPLWEQVQPEIRQRADDGVRITIFLSPGHGADADCRLSALAAVPGVAVYDLDHPSGLDLLLIDGKHLRIAHHDTPPGGGVRAYWQSGPAGAPGFMLRFAHDHVNDTLRRAKLRPQKD